MTQSKVFSYDIKTVPKTEIDLKYSLDRFQNDLLEKCVNPPDVKSLTLSQKIAYQIEHKIKLGKIYSKEEFVNPLPANKTMYHNGYIEYLIGAWYHDLGIEVAPWYIWNVVFKEVCEMVNKNPEQYRSLFTQSSEQIKLTQLESFNIQTLIDQLRRLVPADMDKFFPEFSQSPPYYQSSMYGLFGATVQKYYATFIMGCSLPKLRLLGTPEDWQLLVTTLTYMVNLFQTVSTPESYELKYLHQCQVKATEILTKLDDPKYWSTFVYTDRCGSGGEQGVRGHIISFLPIRGEMTTYSLRKTISKFPYESKIGSLNSETSQKFNFVSGIMFSQLDKDGILVPEYHCESTVFRVQTQPLSTEQSAVLDRIKSGLEVRDHYDLNNVHKARTRDLYDLEAMEITGQETVIVPDCIWYTSKVRAYYHSNTLEGKLKEDGFNLTTDLYDQVMASRTSDFQTLIETLPYIYDYFNQENLCLESLFRPYLCTFNFSVIQTMIKTYINQPCLFEVKRSYYDTIKINSIGSFLDYVLTWIQKQNYVHSSIRNHLHQQILGLGRDYKLEYRNFLVEKIKKEMPPQYKSTVLEAKTITDLYDLPTIDLYDLL